MWGNPLASSKHLIVAEPDTDTPSFSANVNHFDDSIVHLALNRLTTLLSRADMLLCNMYNKPCKQMLLCAIPQPESRGYAVLSTCVT